MPVFRKTIFNADCDRCGARFDPVKGGVCESCRQILCGRHMHGSLARRLQVAFGAPRVCTTCRAAPAAPRKSAGRGA